MSKREREDDIVVVVDERPAKEARTEEDDLDEICDQEKAIIANLETDFAKFLNVFDKEGFAPSEFKPSDFFNKITVDIAIKKRLVALDRAPVPISKFFIRDWIQLSRSAQERIKAEIKDWIGSSKVGNYLVFFVPKFTDGPAMGIDKTVYMMVRKIVYQQPA